MSEKEKREEDVPQEKPQDLDSTRKIDREETSDTTRLHAMFKKKSTLNIFSGFLRSGTTELSDILSGDGSENSKELNTEQIPRSDELVDFESCFEIQEMIAEGGQGEIHKALDKKLARIIAVKTLKEKLTESNRFRHAFLAEARITAQLDHPAIVPVHGIYGDSKNGLHLAMKRIKGNTLRQYLDKTQSLYRALPYFEIRKNEWKMLPQRLDLFLRVCEAIAYAHHKKIIHRDLKPENIMIGSFHETYVMDWGIAEHQTQKKTSIDTSKLIGSVHYIAPELITSQPYDSRSDIYSLGLILFEIIFLKQGYIANSMEEALRKAQHSELEPYTHEFGYPVDLDLKMILKKALAPIPSERYQNVKSLIRDIRNYLQGEEVSANPDHMPSKILRFIRHHNKAMLVFSSLLLACLLGGASYLLYHESKNQQFRLRQDAALTEIYSRGIHAGIQLEQNLHSLENLLIATSWATALLYENKKETFSSNQTIYPLGTPNQLPPGFDFSRVYRQKISLLCSVATLPSGKSIQDYRTLLNQMNPITHLFFSTISQSLTAIAIPVTQQQEMYDIIRNQMKPPFSWVYVTFSDGLHLAYPYHTDYETSYDSRKKTWYLDAVNEKQKKIVWGTPYIGTGEVKELIITCSKAIVDQNNKVLGAAGADLSLSWLRGMLSKSGNTGSAIRNKILIDEKGRILVDCSYNRFGIRDSTEEGLKEFQNEVLLKEMWKRKNGRLFAEENGHRFLYFFIEISSVRWLYVERIDLDRFMRERAFAP